jgi:predicted metal-binding transcription factor (methanogenesis marker protein 9)
MIHGQKRSGKDYLANKIIEVFPSFQKYAFADPLKDIISITFDITREELDNHKNEEDGLYIYEDDMIGYKKITDFRKVLQYFGTEAMKKYFGNNVWADLFVKKYNESDNKDFIISDYRFYEDEFLYLKNKINDKIITIKIKNNNKHNDSHKSEKEIPDNYFDYIFDNSNKSEGELKKFVEMFVEKELGKRNINV